MSLIRISKNENGPKIYFLLPHKKECSQHSIQHFLTVANSCSPGVLDAFVVDTSLGRVLKLKSYHQTTANR